MTNFDLQTYFTVINDKIFRILSFVNKENITFDILDSEQNTKIQHIILMEKQKQMKIGYIWQEVLGNYDKFENLGVAHETGLDIISRSRKIIIELKNRTNTDNSSSKKHNFDKLSIFKKNNPDYTCIYGNVNDKTKEKTQKGCIKTIVHNGVEIKHYIGFELLKLILNDDVDVIINVVKKIINNFSNIEQ